MLRKLFAALVAALVVVLSLQIGFAFAEDGGGGTGGGGGQTTDTVELALNPSSPQGSALEPWQWTYVTKIDVTNMSPGTIGQISELWVTRKGTATDSDLSSVYVYYQYQSQQAWTYWLGAGSFVDGKAFIILQAFPTIAVGETLTLFFEIAPVDTAQHGATFSLGIEAETDFEVIDYESGDPASAFNIVGTPIYGNEFWVDNPPKPELTAWLDDFDYGPKDAMTLTADVRNLTDTDLNVRIKRWAETENGSPVKGTIKNFSVPLPAGTGTELVLFYTKDLPAGIKAGYYYWVVEMYDQSTGELLDREYVWWQFIK